ncbi:hepatic lectin-like, partial [Agelaius phoeniceus]|uniref:hepatic lectin-like n=1 Tax=Agelaius phoeniceus TaxID=39638 RepID=UPI004054BD9E
HADAGYLKRCLAAAFVDSNGQDGGRSGLGPPTGAGALPARLRSFPAVYLSLALSSLLLLGLSALALARVSSISSKLHQEKQEWNFSSWDSFLFPCGADSREWEYFSGNCYYFSLARLSWERARERCRERRADLAVVGSFAEQQFLMSRARNERFWIGLTDRNSEGNWEWVDGTDYKSSFTFWREGEPNDSGKNEDCAHLWISGKWNDVHCTFECFFVCERPLSQKSPFAH